VGEDTVFCPVSPELVERMRQPDGYESRGRVRMRLDQDNVIVVEEIDLQHGGLFDLLREARDALDHAAHRRGETCWGCFMEDRIDKALAARFDRSEGA
jgi:hypothetical protein